MRKLGYWLRTVMGGVICALLFAMYLSPQMQAIRQLPRAVSLEPGQFKQILDIKQNDISVRGDSVEVRSSYDQSLSDVQGAVIGAVEPGKSELTLSLFGLPLKSIAVNVDTPKIVVPGGHSVGVALHTQGALVVGTSDIISPDGAAVNPAREAGVQPGDVIKSVNGEEVSDANHLSDMINNTHGSLTMGVLRDGSVRIVTLTPRKDAHDSKLRLGLWVRDSTVGVGTLTFYDPGTNVFGALGHAITDIDTRTRLSVASGEIMHSQIIDVKQGARGEPGELKGSFTSNGAMGQITKNTDFGIFGKAKEPVINSLYPDGIPVASQYEVKTGEAEILSTIDNTGIKRFKCEILRVQSQTSPSQRGMVFHITDEALLNATGGIVQGMSGSPIIQNGKLVGAVTHVFVNDPTRGYGMFIEWMLGESK